MQILFKNDIVYNTLRERIRNGIYPVGHKLPPELEFARELHVAKVTLRTALARLEHEKIVVRMHGKGTFVSNVEPLSHVCTLAVISDENSIGSPIPYLITLLNKTANRRGIILEHIDRTIFETLPTKMLKLIFAEKKIEGIAVMTSNFSGHEPLIMRIRSLKLPVVLPHGQLGDAERTGFATVTVDTRKTFGDTIDYVLQKGFRRIAVLGLEANGEKKCRGYAEKDLRKMLGGKMHALHYVPYDMDSMDKTIQKIYSTSAEKPDVFVCYSDLTAILLFAVLDKKGIKIPNDVSVIGYSGLTCDFIPGLRITGSKYRYREMIETALDLLDRHEDWYSPTHDYAAPEITIPCDFVEGDSICK